MHDPAEKKKKKEEEDFCMLRPVNKTDYMQWHSQSTAADEQHDWLVLKHKLRTSYLKGCQVCVLYTASCIASVTAHGMLLPMYVTPLTNHMY